MNDLELLQAQVKDLTAKLLDSEAHVKRLQIDIGNNYVHKDKATRTAPATSTGIDANLIGAIVGAVIAAQRATA